MADKLDLPHPAKLVPAKKNYLKLLTPETPNNFLTMHTGTRMVKK